jgi:hypothetical protein
MLWWTADMSTFSADDKSAWDWIMMIMHHEIYLSDPRRSASEKMKTIIRQPVTRDGTS